MNQTSSRSALRRLLIVVAFTVGIVIFAYGWTVTDINLDRPQEPIRQQNVGNALRELLSPNVFQQDYQIQSTSAPILMNCATDGSEPPFENPPAAPAEGDPYIVVASACASSGDIVTIQGYNFYPDSLARINWLDESGEPRIRQVIGVNEDNFVTNTDGTFTVQIEVPRIRGSAGETHMIEALGRTPVGVPRLSNTTGLVLEKMVETIFLALVATVISILPSAILSFFAAHNLMRSVRMSLGNLLVSFILLPVGWVIGQVLLGQIGMLALNLSQGEGFTTASVSAVSLFLFSTVTSSRLQPSDMNLSAERLRSALNVLIAGVIFVIALGLLGGLSILFGRLFDTGFGGILSTFIGSIGELIQLSLPLIAGITGAFVLSSIGTSLTIDALKRVDITTAHILGGILGALAGAFLLGFTATIGMQAAWLGLLTPIVAASLGAEIFPMIYNRLSAHGLQNTTGVKSVRQILSWAGAVLTFVFTFTMLNLGRALIEGTLPPQDVALSLGSLSISTHMLKAMLIGLALGGISGTMTGTKSAFPIGEILYTVTRTILNALRSTEPLIMGLVFVIWVGIGPFAGVLALTLHSIASLGKLYSEQIENIDNGPLEALQSTGANRLQTIMYAVVPQIIPPYIAFTMYRWDINVRMSTIIGFVGGGGVGFLLQQQINLLRYRDAGVAVLAIAIVVSILDYASASIRERVI
jgi:phosphonate ABC transporter permease subunit PhnE